VRTLLKGDKMGKCASDCVYLRDESLTEYVTAESGGYCTKRDKEVWFDEECSDYKQKEIEA
jgi:hypothetical protein